MPLRAIEHMSPAAARGMGVDGKPEGMNGRLAPALWAEGKREELLRYVGQDVRTTLDLATGCESCGAFRWVARSGKMRCMTLGEGWLAVEEARSLPLPDTSWMDEPWPRERFTGWMPIRLRFPAVSHHSLPLQKFG